MKPIHQLVHTLSYGDAISSEVLALQRAFRTQGRESEVYALNVHPNHEGKARKLAELSADIDAEIILHYSLGSPLNPFYKNLSKAKRSLIYHNLTPPKWFEGVNPRIVRDIREGQKELPDLLACTDRIIADSKFNALELTNLGFQSEVLELPVDPARWDAPSNPGIASLVRSQPGVHLLHVGRIAPNKCIEDIIRTFYFLHHYISKESKLWLVGIDIDTELYSFGLKRLVYQLRLEDAVQFVGCMADAEVRALYENSTAYLCMSEHEGFCLPVIEAMHFGLPVIGYHSSALPDTIGNGGILFKEKRYVEIAELIWRIHEQHDFRDALVQSGKARVAELTYDNFEKNVRALFGAENQGQQAHSVNA